MLAELTIEPIGKGSHLAAPLARVVDLVAASGLPFQVTAMGTLVEGEPEKVWDLLRHCHELARNDSGRVITEIRIDDRGDTAGALLRNVERIEEVLGKTVPRSG